MKVSPHLLRLYYKTARRYKKLTTRLKKQVSSGQFQQHSAYARNELITKLQKLKRRFLNLKLQIRLAVATGTAVLLLDSTTINAQSNLGPFERQPRKLNPLPEAFIFSREPSPAVADLDSDGDLDVVVGSYYRADGIRYFKNEGSSSSPVIVEAESNVQNPFYGLSFSGESVSPSFGDIDKDGDLDMLVGLSTGEIQYFKNTGTAQAPVFTLQSGTWNASLKTGNPFNGVYLGSHTSPHCVDFDKDGDADVIFGSNSDYKYYETVHYYVNNGDGSFTRASLDGINLEASSVAPTTIDFDKDGDLDVFTGESSGYIRYFKNSGSAFEAQTTENNPFSTLEFGQYSTPVFLDFDNDGDYDLLVGHGWGYRVRLDYFENKGNGVYEKKIGTDNPFGGVNVSQDASPFFTDMDKDSDLDLLIGNKYYTSSNVRYYKNENGNYVEQLEKNNPFSTLEIADLFTPSFVDLNGDGEKDLVGGADGYYGNPVEYFKYENGVFVSQPFSTGPFKNITTYRGKTDFTDIDADGDYDLFISDYINKYEAHVVRYYKNTGTSTAPVFTEQTGFDNPLRVVAEQYTIYPRFVDIDHDGDYDALIAESGDTIENSDGNEFSYYENTGTPDKPVFTYRGDIIEQGLNPQDPSPAFTDQDNDGDLDIFMGDAYGNLSYYKNTNPAAVTTLKTSIIDYKDGSGVVIIDPELTLTDADQDFIVSAVVSISNFIAGDEVLTFTAQPGITGAFDASAGTLTFKGKAPLAVYQTLLRTVAFQFTGDMGGRKKNTGRTKDITQAITFNVFDADFTTPVPTSRSVTIDFNAPPVITPEPLRVTSSSTIELNLLTIISDPDGNLDAATIEIIEQPISGAQATIEVVSSTEVKLVLDYSGVDFSGTDQLRIRACDDLSACTENTISIEVDVASNVQVYNAVAPHSTGDNQYMRIMNLSAGNKVSIYNRWGDEVFQIENYDNDIPGKRFEGLNDNGKELSTGTYYYKIEFSDGSKTLTGYLALKQ